MANQENSVVGVPGRAAINPIVAPGSYFVNGGVRISDRVLVRRFVMVHAPELFIENSLYRIVVTRQPFYSLVVDLKLGTKSAYCFRSRLISASRFEMSLAAGLSSSRSCVFASAAIPGAAFSRHSVLTVS